MEIKYPDYENGILNVSNSVLKHFGAEPLHATLPVLDEALGAADGGRGAKKVILLLFDGLGRAILEKNLPERSFLRRHLVCGISSVFPPTTVAATTTVQCARTPTEHGWLGWLLYFRDIDKNVIAFRNLSVPDGKPAAPEHLCRTRMPYIHICDRICEAAEKDGRDVFTAVVSPFAEYKCSSAESLCRETGRLASEHDSCFIYGYWETPDSIMHRHGLSSWRVKMNVRRIDRAVRRLSRRFGDDTVIAVIADHGLVDVEYEYLSDHQELWNMLSHAPSLETRALSLFVKPEYVEAFPAEFRKAFGDRYLLLSHDEVFEKGLFGPGEIHPEAEQFIGDYLAVATGRYGLSSMRGFGELKAHHAGLTADEMTVPLIIC